jgi:ribose/xylose/arabinose/galactoside ABC-type transport system permease subunit
MEMIVTLILFYLAVGAALFAHASYPSVPGDFDWRTQRAIFCATFADVVAWPLALFRLCAEHRN